ncbi:MAG: hypothetical protein ACLGIF_04790 [Actinomycetes bacterium]
MFSLFVVAALLVLTAVAFSWPFGRPDPRRSGFRAVDDRDLVRLRDELMAAAQRG